MSSGQFTSIKEQIERLKKDCNIIVGDDKNAAMILKTVGYSWLLDTYGEFFKQENENRLFINGTRIEDIYAFYNFDLDLKSFIFPYLFRIEMHIKALLGYYFPKQYSYKEDEYLSAGKYYNEHGEGEDAVAFMRDALEKYKNDRRMNMDSNVPLWDLVNNFTCGELYNFYKFLKHDIRGQICAEFLTVEENTLEEMLRVLYSFRNSSVHDRPLFNNTINIEKDAEQMGWCTSGKWHTFFDCVQTIAYLSNIDEANDFVDEIIEIIKELEEGVDIIVFSRIVSVMGFGDKWEEQLAQLKVPKPIVKYYTDSTIDNELGTVNAVEKPERPVNNSKTKRAIEKDRDRKTRRRKHKKFIR